MTVSLLLTLALAPGMADPTAETEAEERYTTLATPTLPYHLANSGDTVVLA
jgi:hypothetical protein